MTTFQTCHHCGAEIHGTPFCESCGTPASAATGKQEEEAVSVGGNEQDEVAASATIDQAAEATVSTTVRSTALREPDAPPPLGRRRSSYYLLALFSYLGYVAVPAVPLLTLGVSNRGFDFIAAVLLLAAGLLAAIAAFTSHASPARSFYGGILGVGFLLTAAYSSPLYAFYFTYSMTKPIRISIWVLSLALFFAAWAVTRPLGGPGYFALAVGAVTVGVRIAWQLFGVRAGVVAGVVDAALMLLVVVGTVLAAIAFSKLASSRAKGTG